MSQSATPESLVPGSLVPGSVGSESVGTGSAAAGSDRTGSGSRLRRLREEDDGMSTVEYAIGTVTAAAFAAILYAVISGEPIVAALTGLVQRALSVTF